MTYFFYRQHPERYLEKKTRIITVDEQPYMITVNELVWHAYDYFTKCFKHKPERIFEWMYADGFISKDITCMNERFSAMILYLDKITFENHTKQH